MAADTKKDGVWSLTTAATPTEIVALLRAGVVSADNVVGIASEGSSKFAVLYKIDKGE